MNILAINPWIYDCAAYDFWLKPYGFLVILQFLKKKGFRINFVDCLDKKKTTDDFGRGRYYCEIVDKPSPLKSIPRHFKRYGISPREFEDKISHREPDLILVTSSMTYWYQGVKDVVRIVKNLFPKKPLILGGTYATLCYRHARKNINCDYIFPNAHIKNFFNILNIKVNMQELFSTLPVYEEFYSRLDYVVFRTSWGCPFNCSYCAIKSLQKGFLRIEMNKVIEYIMSYYNRGIKNFVLYDDAFLYNNSYAKGLLKKIASLNLDVNFHTPNALHLRFLDTKIASLMKATGFIHPHFGIETLNEKLQKKWQNKVNNHDLMRALKILKDAGFKNGEFSFYLLLGYPGQDLKELKNEIDFLHSQGARISLAEFSPTPRTKIFNHYRRNLSDPLLHNNSIFPFFHKDKLKELWALKNYVRQLNKKWDQGRDTNSLPLI